MGATIIIFTSIFILIVLVLAIVLLVLASKNNTKIVENKIQHKNFNLEQFFSKINDSKLNTNEIQELILAFVNTQKLPFKSGKNLSTEAKKKLEFVSAVALHQNSTPKNIAFLNKELAKRYPSYKKEIDAYEGMGLSKRKMRAIKE